jgi:hypothetical protein
MPIPRDALVGGISPLLLTWWPAFNDQVIGRLPIEREMPVDPHGDPCYSEGPLMCVRVQQGALLWLLRTRPGRQKLSSAQVLHGTPGMYYVHHGEWTLECIRASAGSLPFLSLSRTITYMRVVVLCTVR